MENGTYRMKVCLILENLIFFCVVIGLLVCFKKSILTFSFCRGTKRLELRNLISYARIWIILLGLNWNCVQCVHFDKTSFIDWN